MTRSTVSPIPDPPARASLKSHLRGVAMLRFCIAFLRLWFVRWVPWLLVLYPALALRELIAQHAINVPFLDDLIGVRLFEKMSSGGLGWQDFFAPDMEHRIAWLRVVMLVFYKLCRGHLFLAQIWFTWSLLGLTLVNTLVLVRQSGLVPVRRCWPMALLASLALYSPVHYEVALWPILHQVAGLAFFVTGGLALWQSQWPVTLRFLLAALCALCAMFSMACGILAWVVMTPVILFSAPGLTARVRVAVLSLWVLVFGVSTGCYMVGLKNEMEPEFSPFSQGVSDTMAHNVEEFLADPLKTLCFAARILGSSLMRGTNLNLMPASLTAGLILLGLYSLSLGWGLWRFRDRELRRKLVPWLALGAYAIGTALAIALGRGWVGTTGMYALSSRYMIHSVPLLLALPMLVLLVGRDVMAWLPFGAPFVDKVFAGSVVAVICLYMASWTYGECMMASWSSARLRSATNALFYKIDCTLESDYPSAPRLARVADDLGLLDPPMLRDRRLDNFKILPSPIRTENAALTALRVEKTEHGLGAVVEGYALLKKSGRVADGIFLTYKDPADSHQEIFHVTQVTALPLYLRDIFARDLDFEFPPEPTLTSSLSAFTAHFDLAKLPKMPCEIAAWAYDFKARTVALIPGSFELNPATGVVVPMDQNPEMLQKLLPKRKKDAAPQISSD